MEKKQELIPVWTVRDGELIETSAEVFGWPHYTTDGEQMFTNTHFKTRGEAIDYGIREYSAGVQVTLYNLNALWGQLNAATRQLNRYKRYLNKMTFLKEEINNPSI